MSGTYATPLHLELGPSRRLRGWLLALHALAMLLLPVAGLPPYAALALAVAIVLSLAWHWPRHVSRTAPACIRTLTWEAERACRLQRRDGTVARATLCGQAFVQPWLVILQLAEPGRLRQHLVVLPDMLDATSYRRLRVRLRLELERLDAG